MINNQLTSMISNQLSAHQQVRAQRAPQARASQSSSLPRRPSGARYARDLFAHEVRERAQHVHTCFKQACRARSAIRSARSVRPACTLRVQACSTRARCFKQACRARDVCSRSARSARPVCVALATQTGSTRACSLQASASSVAPTQPERSRSERDLFALR